MSKVEELIRNRIIVLENRINFGDIGYETYKKKWEEALSEYKALEAERDKLKLLPNTQAYVESLEDQNHTLEAKVEALQSQIKVMRDAIHEAIEILQETQSE